MIRYLVLALIAIVLTAPGIAQMPVMDRDEGRYVMASKQMVEAGDYIDIRNQELPRYKKPVGIYWLQSAAVTISGQGADAPIWVYRTVSVLGAVLAVLGTAWTAAHFFGPQAGFAAGAVLAAIFGVVFEARIAKTDAMLLASAVFAQGALMQIYVAARKGLPTPPWRPVIFWVAIGASILIKGPIVVLLSALTLIALLPFDRDWRWYGRLRVPLGLAIVVVIAVPWYVAITLQSGWAFWDEALLNDLLGKVGTAQEAHWGPPGYYVLTFALYAWPFGAVMILAGVVALARARREPVLLFLACWYIPFWLFFEITQTKLPHYVIPAYPALAIAVAWAMSLGNAFPGGEMRWWQVWLFRLTLFGHVAVTFGLAALAIGGPIYLGAGVNPFGFIAALAVLAAGYFTFPRERSLPMMRRASYGLAAVAMAYALLFTTVVPSFERMWMTPRLHEAFVTHRPCDDTVLAVAEFHEPSLVFMAGIATRRTNVAGVADHLLAAPDCAVGFVADRQADALRAIVTDAGRSIEMLAEVPGLNYSNGRELTMQLYRIVAADEATAPQSS